MTTDLLEEVDNAKLLQDYQRLNLSVRPEVKHIYHLQYRLPLGNWPKWVGYVFRWCFNLVRPYGLRVLLRGRAPKPKHKYGWGGNLKLRHAKRVGIYLIINERA